MSPSAPADIPVCNKSVLKLSESQPKSRYPISIFYFSAHPPRQQTDTDRAQQKYQTSDPSDHTVIILEIVDQHRRGKNCYGRQDASEVKTDAGTG